MLVDIFIPCFVDQLYPETAFNMIKVLERAGCTVNYNSAQTCCGQPAFNAGFWDQCKEVAEKFIGDFSNERYIVTPSASCAGIRGNYGHIRIRRRAGVWRGRTPTDDGPVRSDDKRFRVCRAAEMVGVW